MSVFKFTGKYFFRLQVPYKLCNHDLYIGVITILPTDISVFGEFKTWSMFYMKVSRGSATITRPTLNIDKPSATLDP